MSKKVVFFDMEGTLLQKVYHLDNGKVAPSAWTLIAEYLGPDCLEEEERTKDKWLNCEYSGYVEWMEDTIRIHQKYGLRKEVFFNMVNSSKLMNGAQGLVSHLRNAGYITALISGGFKALADKVQVSLKIDHALSGCEYFFDDQGKIEHYNLLPSDEEGKVDFMNLIIKEHSASSDNCIFIGDGKNDCSLAKAVGFSIAFNAQDELKKVTDISINQDQGKEDLEEIIKLLSKL